MTSADFSSIEDTYPMQVIEWHMLDMYRFYPFALTCSLTVRGMLYPLSVVKTRMQIQRQNTVYTGGVFRTLHQVYRHEGLPGLYKGYLISTAHVLTGVFYVGTFEFFRHTLKSSGLIEDHSLRALLAGGAASACCQTIAVPCDVISQHMMIIGNLGRLAPGATDLSLAGTSAQRVADPLNLAEKVKYLQDTRRLRLFGLGSLVVAELFQRDGFLGFYRGYISSLLLYVPNSAIFWYSYHRYTASLNQAVRWQRRRSMLPVDDGPPQLLLQACAAPVAGCTTALLTNPLDLFRARVQVQRQSYADTVRVLWYEERYNIFIKGLSARLVSSAIFSLLTITGYETVKRCSLSEDYVDKIRW